MKLLFKTKIFLIIELLALTGFVVGFSRKEEGMDMFLAFGLLFVLYFIGFVCYRAVKKLNI